MASQLDRLQLRKARDIDSWAKESKFFERGRHAYGGELYGGAASTGGLGSPMGGGSPYGNPTSPYARRGTPVGNDHPLSPRGSPRGSDAASFRGSFGGGYDSYDSDDGYGTWDERSRSPSRSRSMLDEKPVFVPSASRAATSPNFGRSAYDQGGGGGGGGGTRQYDRDRYINPSHPLTQGMPSAGPFSPPAARVPPPRW